MAASGGCSGWPDGERTSARCIGATSTLVHRWGGHPKTLEIQYLGPQQAGGKGTDGHEEAEWHKLSGWGQTDEDSHVVAKEELHNVL